MAPWRGSRDAERAPPRARPHDSRDRRRLQNEAGDLSQNYESNDHTGSGALAAKAARLIELAAEVEGMVDPGRAKRPWRHDADRRCAHRGDGRPRTGEKT